MAKIVPYLSVSNALEAITFYENIFNVELKDRSQVGEGQAEMFGLDKDTDLSKTTMHAEFEILGETIYISDNFTGKKLDNVNVSILIAPDNVEQAESIFEKVEKTKCKITEEFKQQFWGDYFGAFIDPFGISWQVNYTPEK